MRWIRLALRGMPVYSRGYGESRNRQTSTGTDGCGSRRDAKRRGRSAETTGGKTPPTAHGEICVYPRGQ